MVDWKTRRVPIRPSAWPGHVEDDVFVREAGAGTPILFLHGGWGYGVYPVDAIAADLTSRGFRFVVPDRVGYGRSTALAEQPLDFHQRAAAESVRLLEAMHVERPVLWGHSDGAVIALWMALSHPTRFRALVLESVHFWQNKPASTPFFERVAERPMDIGERARDALEKDHRTHWQHVVRMNGKVWVALAKSSEPRRDLFGGKLSMVAVPTLLLHGRNDPRTEPGELQATHASIPDAELILVDGKHAPHAEPRAWAEAREGVAAFLARVAQER